MREEPAPRFKTITSAASMATRLPTVVVLISILSVAIATIVGVRTGTSLGRDLTEDELVAQRASGAFDTETQLRALGRTTAALASSPQTAQNISSFSEAHGELSLIGRGALSREIDEVVTAARETYIEPLSAAGTDRSLREIVADDAATIYLQYHYAVDLGAIENAATVDDAGDGSRWSEVHDEVHPVYRDVVRRLDLRDLYLVDADDTVVYSVTKRVDLGTSLDVGPFSGSFLARLVDAVRADPDGGVVFSDVSFYDPAVTTPVGAVAAPVRDGDGFAGVLVLMYDAADLTDLLTAATQRDDDTPRGPESYLVGADGRARTDPSAYLEDPRGFVAASVEAGRLTEDQRSFIEAAGTTILTLPIVDETVDAALDGDTAVQRRPSTVGVESFSTVGAVDLDGPEWFVVAEIDVESADGNLSDFVDLLVTGVAIFIIGLAFLSVAWAARIVEPIRAISERLGRGRDELGPIEVSPSSPLEFQRLAESFASMSQALTSQRDQLAEAREERLRLLQRMLPAAIADRVAAGDLESLEEVPQATVVVVVVLGLGGLVRDDESAVNRQLVDSIHGELDDLAARHGVERVKVVGDAYFASCGHSRPYIDHAPRAAGFAIDARDAVREIGAGTAKGLGVAVGLYTGAVTVEVSAANRLLYDVWGWPVTAAHHLARQADRDTILVSATTRDLLPDTLDVSPWSDEDDGIWQLDEVAVGEPS